MSALPPKADIGTQSWNVRYVPKADICTAAITGSLGQMLTDFCQELARAKWFGHVIITAGGLRRLRLTVERVRGDRDDRDRSQRRIGLDPGPLVGTPQLLLRLKASLASTVSKLICHKRVCHHNSALTPSSDGDWDKGGGGRHWSH